MEESRAAAAAAAVGEREREVGMLCCFLGGYGLRVVWGLRGKVLWNLEKGGGDGRGREGGDVNAKRGFGALNEIEKGGNVHGDF